MSLGLAMVAMLQAVAPSATAPSGPPLAESRQTGAPAPSGTAAAPPSAASAGAPPLAPQPAPAAGQPAAGVIAYPAAFFAASQPNTARDMVDRLPGFVFDDGDTRRGFEGAGGDVLVDGVRPSSKSDDLDSILRRIPAGQVDHIDLIRGGAPGIDMQGKSVLANVVRKTAASTTGLVAYGQNWLVRDGRQLPIVRLEATHRDGGTSLEGSLVGAGFSDDGAGDGSRVTRDASGAELDRARDNSAGGGVQLVATGAYERPFAGGKLRANAQLFGQQYFYDETVHQLSTNTLESRERDRQSNEQSEFGLHYNRDFGAKISLESLFLQQVQGEDYLSLLSTPAETDRFREQHSNGETIVRNVLTWKRSDTLTVEGGLEGAYNWQVSHTRFAVNGVGVVLPAANVTVTELRGEAFAKATWRATPKLTLEAGLRVEASHIASDGDVVLAKDLAYPKPRLLVSWSPDADDQLRFRIEQEVGQLNFSDFTASSSLSTGQILAGNPNLEPQQALVLEGAYERRFLKDGAIVLTLRHSELTAVVDRIPIRTSSGVFDAPGNIGNGIKDELIASLNLPLDHLGDHGGLIKAQTTWRGSNVKDLSTGADRAISGLRPLEGEIDFTQDVPEHHLSFGGQFYLGWRERYYRLQQIETDVFGPNAGLFAEWRPRKDLSLRWQLDEIGTTFDRQLRNYPGERGATTIAAVEQRNLRFGPVAYFRVRKTF